jgi:mono/diheme cytochrome c family protein
MSYSATTGLAYIPAIVSSFNYVAAAEGYRYYQGAPNVGLDPVATALPLDPDIREAARASIHGELIAWDPVRRRAAWRVRHDVAWNGGTLSTASGLVFQGDATGELAAYDGATGTKLWSQNLGSGIVAAPITYAVDGVQYIAVAVGWGGGLTQVAGALTAEAKSSGINRLVVLKLEGTAPLPAVEMSQQILDPPAATASPAQVARGRAIYERRCYVCHGGAAISGGEVPDLRYSGAIAQAPVFRAIVREGALAANGMPGFGRDLSDADTEAVRAYVIARANADARANSSAGQVRR